MRVRDCDFSYIVPPLEAVEIMLLMSQCCSKDFCEQKLFLLNNGAANK